MENIYHSHDGILAMAVVHVYARYFNAVYIKDNWLAMLYPTINVRVNFPPYYTNNRDDDSTIIA